MHIVVAMSGGVDSTVVCALLQEQGHQVTGITMRLLDETLQACGMSTSGKKRATCCSAADVADARAACDRLGVPHYVIDMSEDFETHVVAPFDLAYREGKTPNPCIACNRFLKFELLWQRAKMLGAEAIATGHYARIIKQEGKPALLARGAAHDKDQSYVLYPIRQEVLAHTILPLGEFDSKDEVRKVAERLGLSVAHKRDSQDICFVPDGDYAGFLQRRRKELLKSGLIKTLEGEVVAEHDGIEHFTIGQRKGLGFAAGKRKYVVSLDARDASVVIGDEEDLYSSDCIIDEVVWPSGEKSPISEPIACEVVLRHHGRPHAAQLIRLEDERVHIICDEPIRAIARGQHAVAYAADVVICGGIIQ